MELEEEQEDEVERRGHEEEDTQTTKHCEGCLVVGGGHGPQAEVAQGFGPEPLVEH